MRLWRTILHPTDFSEASNAAFEEAVKLAAASQAELVLLHVVTPASAYEIQAIGWADLHRRDEEARRRWAKHQIRHLVRRARRHGVRTRANVTTGAPDREIVITAEAIGADLVVLGSHGWHVLGWLLFGTTARRVIGAARCPVLTVRAPAKPQLRATRPALAVA
jgi:nucleotide-binding universal stress UspA family protein